MPMLNAIRISVTFLASLVLSSSAWGQLSLPGAMAKPDTTQAPESISDQRERAAAQLAETQRQRDSDIPGSREIANVEAVKTADRQRLLDRLAFLQSEKIKKLDEQDIVQQGPSFDLSAMPPVQALGHSPPYSALAVDALRDELEGLRQKYEGLIAGLQLREAEKHSLVEQKRRADEAVRLSNDRFAMARGDSNKLEAKWDQEQSELRQRVAEAELGVLAIDEETLKLKAAQLRTQIDGLKRLVDKALLSQQLTETDLETQRGRMIALRQGLLEEIDKVSARRRTHERERSTLQAKAPAPESAEGQRLLLLNQALITDGVVLDGLSGLDTLLQVTSDAWEKRFLVLSGPDEEQKRLASASLQKLHQGLVNRKRLSDEQRKLAQEAIRAQETRLANTLANSPQHRDAKELLGLLQERAGMRERLDSSAGRLERQLARWIADFKQTGGLSLGGQANQFRERIESGLKAFWQYELFAVEDVSEIDGRKVSVSYGVTMGKGIGSILFFVVGYWLFSRFAQWFQRILVSRFEIGDQLASVIRRWVMILLAIGLLVFVLNLSRIPLTVFAFMGGALAIGVGFGTQTIIKNFISGMIILFERKIRVGDIIELGGLTGHVTAVDLRATTVRGFNGVEALIPNSNFLENQVVNWTYSNHLIRRELRVGIAYGSDSRAAETLLLRAASENKEVLTDPAPDVLFEDFSDNAVLMVLVFWVELGPNMVARKVDSDLRHSIYQQLAEAGIAIPFPQRDVHLDTASPLTVNVVDARAVVGFPSAS